MSQCTKGVIAITCRVSIKPTLRVFTMYKKKSDYDTKKMKAEVYVNTKASVIFNFFSSLCSHDSQSPVSQRDAL